jgi:hypothetical protein
MAMATLNIDCAGCSCGDAAANETFMSFTALGKQTERIAQ